MWKSWTNLKFCTFPKFSPSYNVESYKYNVFIYLEIFLKEDFLNIIIGQNQDKKFRELRALHVYSGKYV